MNNVSTLELELNLPIRLQDLLIAELDAAGFTGFVQEGRLLKAYLPATDWTPRLRESLQQWLDQHGIETAFGESEIAPQDWNKAWEASIEPVEIAPFYVRPSWSRPREGCIDVVVDPKMSFGTGHHETTRLLLGMMPRVISAGCNVLDAGTGTAILAIAAAKLQAASVVAFDIDPWVTDNVRENLKLNGVEDRVVYREGGIEVVPEHGFDVILANINRNVLLDYLDAFAARLAPGGSLCLSGILVQDRQLMVERAAAAGFDLDLEVQDGAWWAGVCSTKSPSS